MNAVLRPRRSVVYDTVFTDDFNTDWTIEYEYTPALKPFAYGDGEYDQGVRAYAEIVGVKLGVTEVQLSDLSKMFLDCAADFCVSCHE